MGVIHSFHQGGVALAVDVSSEMRLGLLPTIFPTGYVTTLTTVNLHASITYWHGNPDAGINQLEYARSLSRGTCRLMDNTGIQCANRSLLVRAMGICARLHMFTRAAASIERWPANLTPLLAWFKGGRSAYKTPHTMTDQKSP